MSRTKFSKPNGQNVTVNFTIADGVACATSDYVANNGTLSFTPGSGLTRTISITINGDTAVEGNETLFVFLCKQSAGVGTITNDDVSA